ncbi:MAG: hypothetical protein ACO3A4_14560 [Silvanigrellaceae bacterium]
MDLKKTHDDLLAKDMKRQSGALVVLYLVTGVLAIVVGTMTPEKSSLWFVGLGGFLLGMSLEKLATRQIRRVAKQLAEQQKQ